MTKLPSSFGAFRDSASLSLSAAASFAWDVRFRISSSCFSLHDRWCCLKPRGLNDPRQTSQVTFESSPSDGIDTEVQPRVLEVNGCNREIIVLTQVVINF